MYEYGQRKRSPQQSLPYVAELALFILPEEVSVIQYGVSYFNDGAIALGPQHWLLRRTKPPPSKALSPLSAESLSAASVRVTTFAI
jgi:hypothetical protein